MSKETRLILVDQESVRWSAARFTIYTNPLVIAAFRDGTAGGVAANALQLSGNPRPVFGS